MPAGHSAVEVSELAQASGVAIDASRVETRLLSDAYSSLDEPGKDAFGHRDYVESLVSLVESAPSPSFTLGLFGPWGSGKTHIIETAGERLANREDLAYVYVDVWRYEGEALRREFLKSVASQLNEAGRVPKYPFEDEMRELHMDTQVTEDVASGLSWVRLKAWLKGLPLALGMSAAVFVVAILLLRIPAIRVRGTIGTQIDNTVEIVAVFAAALLGALLAQLPTIVRVVQSTGVMKRIEEPEEFSKRFELLLGYLDCSRLVVAVDNLDRCNAERVVELLGTIKAYLEPVTHKQGKKQVVFVVAADDAALRRHLAAQEAGIGVSSHGTFQPGDSSVPAFGGALAPGAQRDADAYVDEYLRKFFSGTLRIREILSEDMGAFIAAELTKVPLVASLEADKFQQLVQMVASALLRNPRRVKQFVNNLQIRYQLLVRRVRAGAMTEAAITGDAAILALSKLQIIEEEWPDFMSRLRENPSLLTQWSTTANTGEVRGDESGSFSAFLRSSRNVTVGGIRALLAMKQTKAEVSLPGHDDFVVGLLTRNQTDLQMIVDSADPDVQTEYWDILPGAVEGELQHQNVPGAIAAIDSSLLFLKNSPSSLHAAVDSLKLLIAFPQARAELVTLPPSALHQVVGMLGRLDRDLVYDTLANLELVAQKAPSQLREAAQHIADVVGDLGPSARQVLTKSLDRTAVATEFDVYLPIMQADAGLIPSACGEAAFESLKSSFETTSAAFQVLVLSMSHGDNLNHGDEVLMLAAGTRQITVDADSGARDAWLHDVRRVISLLSVIAEDSAVAAGEALKSSFSAMDVEQKVRAVELVAALFDKSATARVRTLLDWFVGDAFAEEQEAGLRYAELHRSDLPDAIRSPVLDRLRAIARGDGGIEKAVRAAACLASIATDDAISAMTDSLSEAVNYDRFDCVTEVLRTSGSSLAKEQRERLLMQLSERLRAVSTDKVVANGGAVLAMADDLTDEIGNAFCEGLRDRFRRSGQDGDAARAVGERLKTIPTLHRLADVLVRSLFDDLISQPPVPNPNQVPLLGFVASSRALLAPAQVENLVDYISDRLRENPGYHVFLVDAAGELADLSAAQREKLASSLIYADRTQSDINIRVSLLSAARTVVGNRRSRAKTLLESRLTELGQSREAADRDTLDRLNAS